MVMVPLTRNGLGWLLTGIVTAAFLAWIAAESAEGDDTAGGHRNIERAGWALATILLLGVGTIRDAGWLFLLCVLTALLTGTLAVSRARTLGGMGMAVIMMAPAAVKGIEWVTYGVTSALRRRRAVAGGDAMRTVAAGAVGMALVVVFGALLSSADPAFSRLVSDLMPNMDDLSLLRGFIVFLVTGAMMIAGAFLMVNPTRYGQVATPAVRPVRRVELVLPIGALIALFALFSVVQLTIFVGDEAYVRRTAGLTFAEYARGGFTQLAIVTVLTLLVMMVAIHIAPRQTRADRGMLRLLLVALSACALVIVASALRRMWLYEQAYGFTRWRISVSACELWLGALFVLITIAAVRLRADWVPRAGFAVGVAVLLGLAALNPDRLIASESVDWYERTGIIDLHYLRTLSADAADAFEGLPEEIRACVLRDIVENAREEGDWTEYNLSRESAKRLDLPEGTLSGTCQYDVMTGTR